MIGSSSDAYVVSERQILEYLELNGQQLVNSKNLEKIIELIESITGTVKLTENIKLYAGLSYYYLGSLYKSLATLKSIDIKSEKLEKPYFVKYLILLCKISLGFEERSKISDFLETIPEENYLYSYVAHEKAREEYFQSGMVEEKQKKLERVIEKILNSNKTPTSLKNFCSCDLILIKGAYLNDLFVRTVAQLNSRLHLGKINIEEFDEVVKQVNSDYSNWKKYTDMVMDNSVTNDDHAAFHLAAMNQAKAIYQFEVYSDYIYPTESSDLEINPNKEERTKTFLPLLKNLTKAKDYFNKLGHVENAAVVVATEYEIESYCELESHKDRLKEMKEIYKVHENERLKIKIQEFEENRAFHETFSNFIVGLRKKAISDMKEYDQLVSEMETMDEKEKAFKDLEDACVFQLFPIGHFNLSISKIELFFNVLSCPEVVRKNYKHLIGMNIVPKMNILYEKVTEMGLRDGFNADQGIENWRNIYKVRKFLFENKQKRNEDFD